MADVFGVNATKPFNTSPAEKVEVNKWRGSLRTMNDTFEAAAAVTGTDVIVGRIQKGAEIQADTLIQFDDLGTGTTLDLVTRSVADGSTEVVLAAGIDTATAAGVLDCRGIAFIDVFPHVTTEEVDIIIKLQDATSTGTIKSHIVYVDD